MTSPTPPVTATCLACGTPHCKCPRPTPAEVDRCAAIGRRVLALAQAAALRGHVLTTEYRNGRLLMAEVVVLEDIALTNGV